MRSLSLAMDVRRPHIDRLVLDLGLGLRRAHVDADPAAGAVVRGHLDRHEVTDQVLGTERLGQEPFRCAGKRLGSEDLHADGPVRADAGALAAVDANVGVPDRDLRRNGSFFVAGRPRREAAVRRERRDGQEVALAGHDRCRHVTDEVRRGLRDKGAERLGGCRLLGHLDLGQVGQRGVDGGEVALHDGAAPLAVGLLDRGLDLGHRLLGRQYPREGEKARLHYGVDPVAELMSRLPPGRRR